MKRKPLILALTLLLVVGAALWGVNYRLDHPPLTKADKEFRALVAGADSMKATQARCQNSSCVGDEQLKFGPLDAEQTRDVIDKIRVFDKEVSPSQNQKSIFINLSFYKKGRYLYGIILFQNATSSEIVKQVRGKNGYSFPSPPMNYKLNPRFNKRLNRVLDAYLPQRVRP